MSQQTGQENEARKHIAKEWENMKPEITRLYESGTLENVIKSMAEQHGFNATPKQYKDRLGKWGLNKNIQQGDYEYMVRKREERQSESNKQTGFRVRGRPVKEEKIQRYMRDRPKELAAAANDDDDVDMDRNMSPADTPAGISYYTPSDTGPFSPQEASSPQTSLRPHSDTDLQHSANSQPPSQQSGGSNSISSNHSNSYLNQKSDNPPPPLQGKEGFDQGAPQVSSQTSDLIDESYSGQRGNLPEDISASPGSGYHGGYGRPHLQYPPQPNYYPPRNYGSPLQQGSYVYGYPQPPPQYPYGYSQPLSQRYGGYTGIPVMNPLYGRSGSPTLPFNTDPNAPAPPSEGTRSLDSDAPAAPQSYSFQYSNCTGRRKALLIGINYFRQRGQLRGCINDVKNMSAFLHENFGYQRDDMVILTDDQQNIMSQPTKQNILRAMHWLVKDAQPNDSLFFHYSGHGGQAKDLDGDEEDGYDEVIYPVDFRQVGYIVDDEMHRILVRSLQPGVRLTAIFDSCHSGTALDLPYIYSTQGVLKEPNLAKEAGQGLLSVIAAYSQGDLGGVANNLMGFFKKATGGDDAYNKTLLSKTSPADVIMWSGSKDSQTSADATIATQATGAMSWAFIRAIKKNSEQSYCQLLNSIRDELATKYTQKPQLSCSHPLNTNIRFVM